MKTSPASRKTIEIDKYGKFDIYGSSPWYLLKIGESQWMITDAPPKVAVLRPRMYNCLVKINNRNVRVPVVFSGPTGYVIGEELLGILNSKL